MKIEAQETAIRRATPDDALACAEILNDWIDATPWMLPRIYDRTTIEGFVKQAFEQREIWVSGDPLNAYLSFNPETLQIVAVYCRAPGNGIGKALMDRVRDGRNFVWLTTHAPNLRAQAFYRREGFIETARLAPEPPEVVEEIRMEWRR